MKGHEFSTQLRQGKYTSLGGYPTHLVLADGATICWACANENRASIRLAAWTRVDKQWIPEGFEVNWETYMACDNCSKDIEAAYEILDEEES